VSSVATRHCDTHDVDYPRVGQCPRCRVDAAAVRGNESPKADTSVARVRAAEYRANQFECWGQSMASKIDDPQVAVKWSAEAGKWAGRADLIELKLLEIEHEQWVFEQDQKRRGGS